MRIIAILCAILVLTAEYPQGFLFTTKDCHVRYYNSTNLVGYSDRSNYIKLKNHLFNVYETLVVAEKYTWYRVASNAWVYSGAGEYYKAEPVPRELISDANFTWQGYTLSDVRALFKKLPANRFTDEEVRVIYRASKVFKVSFLVICAKLEQESSTTYNIYSAEDYKWRMDRAMGYWMPNKEMRGFYEQVWNGTACLRYWYDHYKPGYHVKMRQLDMWHRVNNAATFALFLYTPHYGHCDDGRPVVSMGNYNFLKYYQELSNIYHGGKK